MLRMQEDASPVGAPIIRTPDAAAEKHYDVVIIGGGIYGAMLLLEATRAGLQAVLLERGDFGEATSSNHFRIVHGGLRYLQSADLPRFRESVRERRWFLQTFPDLVVPLRCTMPLYGEGLRRAAVMRAALWLNDRLAAGRNEGVRSDRHLREGHILPPDAVRQAFPVVPGQGLQGAAVWYDALMLHSNRILIEVLRWACAYGARALNYVEATGLVEAKGTVQGVRARDRQAGREHTFRARTVLNAAGPWVRTFASRAHQDQPALFRPSVAWNVQFDRPPLGPGALAVKPPGPGRRTYFLAAWAGKLVAGTGHAPCAGVEARQPQPADADLQAFLDDLNEALPDLGLTTDAIERVYAGYLPVERTEPLVLADHPVTVDHGRQGGPAGLVSLSGVKYTTARAVAERTVRYMTDRYLDTAGRGDQALGPPPPVRTTYRLEDAGAAWQAAWAQIAEEEAVQQPEDLVERRTDWSDHPGHLQQHFTALASLFG